MDALDNATAMNLENLEKVGQNLLKQPVYSMNVTTFQPEEEKEWGTNAKALKRCVNYIFLVFCYYLSLCFLVCELPYRELERNIGVDDKWKGDLMVKINLVGL